MNAYEEIEVFNNNLELKKDKRINEGIEDKFEPDINTRYRVCYTVATNNKRYTRLFNSLELAEFIYNTILKKNKYKDVYLYEVNEQRRRITNEYSRQVL